MKSLDWTIVAVYLAYVIGDGVRMRKNTDRPAGYFLADRSLPWWAVGLSVMATQLSAITLVGTTGQAYTNGMRFIQFYYGLPLAMIILCVTVVPFFYRAKVFTAYEYLESRFDARTRTLTSILFLVSRCLGVGVIISAPSVVLSVVLGWNLPATVFTIGLSTTLYTMLGGVRAVTWTDVKQILVVCAGLTTCLIIIVHKFPAGVSLGDALHLAGATGRLTTIDPSFSLKETYTLWSGLIGALFLFLSYFGCDQSQVQRFLTARSVDQGRTSLLMSAFLKIPLQALVLFIGVMVFVFYQFQQPPFVFDKAQTARIENSRQGDEFVSLASGFEKQFAARRQAALEYLNTGRRGDETGSSPALQGYLAADASLNETRRRALDLASQVNGGKAFNDVNDVFPRFVIENMPEGVVGLMIAAIFAAAMSSSSAELNSLATTSVMDIYRRHFRPGAEDRHYARAGKIATAFWGVFACLVALYATSLGSLIEVVNRLGSYFYGSLLGVFVLAIGVRRATARGAFWGLLLGMLSVGLVSHFTQIAFLWYNAVGCLAVVGTGYLLSLTQKPPPS